MIPSQAMSWEPLLGGRPEDPLLPQLVHWPGPWLRPEQHLFFKPLPLSTPKEGSVPEDVERAGSPEGPAERETARSKRRMSANVFQLLTILLEPSLLGSLLKGRYCPI